MSEPFLITSLPHSRTAWMAAFCTTDRSFCDYEVISGLDTVEDLRPCFTSSHYEYAGVSDCALSWFLPWIMKNISPRTVIIERSVSEVNAGLNKLGIPLTNYCDVQLERLRAFRNHRLVKWVNYCDLDEPEAVFEMQKHLMPALLFDYKRYALLKRMHIEISMENIGARVQQRKAAMNNVLADVIPLIRPLEVV